MAETLLVKGFQYHRWANLHLLDACARLSEEQLGLTAGGTYGTIADTFLHLLGAEQRYIRRLTGTEPRIGEQSEFPGLAALRNEAESSGDRLIELAATVTAEQDIAPERLKNYSRLAAWVVLLQALHHGNDHRTHICTILGSHGLEYGDMDVWAYGRSLGAAVAC
ncbi:MAG TPA: DinB family protein [Candidatus Dormibacteraeota bacterium]|nr:DinB family protein [Candidatus Dormibacteraeota bacterium]